METYSDVASSDSSVRPRELAEAVTAAEGAESARFDIDNDIRIAGPADFQEIFRVCCLLHQENGQHPFSEQKARHLIWCGVNRDNAVVGVIGPSDIIKGLIFLSIDPVYYSDDHQLVELWNYVRPDSRKSDYAKRLIRFAKRCSDETGLDLLIGIISDSRLEAKQRLYQRELSKGGTYFIHKPVPAAEGEKE